MAALGRFEPLDRVRPERRAADRTWCEGVAGTFAPDLTRVAFGVVGPYARDRLLAFGGEH
jgi:hypothetical protein